MITLLVSMSACDLTAGDTGTCGEDENRYGTEAVDAALRQWAARHAACESNADCIRVENPAETCDRGLALSASAETDYSAYVAAMVEAVPCSNYVDYGVACGLALYDPKCVDCVCELVEEGPIDTGRGICAE